MKRTTTITLLALFVVGCGPSCAVNEIPAKSIKPGIDELSVYVPQLVEEHLQSNPQMDSATQMLWDQRLENLQHIKAIVDTAASQVDGQ